MVPAQIASLVVAVLLPSVGISLYFYSVPPESSPEISESDSTEISQKNNSSPDIVKDYPKFSYTRAVDLLWKHFLGSYSNLKVLQWSLWWALAMAGFLMVQIYVQFLWQEVNQDEQILFNAGAEAALTFFGAIAAFLAGFMTSKTFQKFDMWILTICSFVEGVFVVISSQTTSIWIAYAMYVLFGVLYTFMITVASATVAQHLADDSFALIFGINTLFALLFQTILTVIAITWLGLSFRDQFLVYGLYFVGLSLLFLVSSIANSIFNRGSSRLEIETD